jgi:hypothetical protein
MSFVNFIKIIWASKPFRMALYLIFFVIGVGGLGVWISIGQLRYNVQGVSYQSVIGNLATLLIAIAATSLADYVLSFMSEDGATTRLFFLIVAIGAGICGILLLAVPHDDIQRICLWVGPALVVLLWIFVNYRNPNFEEDDPINTLGNNVR